VVWFASLIHSTTRPWPFFASVFYCMLRSKEVVSVGLCHVGSGARFSPSEEFFLLPGSAWPPFERFLVRAVF